MAFQQSRMVARESKGILPDQDRHIQDIKNRINRYSKALLLKNIQDRYFLSINTFHSFIYFLKLIAV